MQQQATTTLSRQSLFRLAGAGALATACATLGPLGTPAANAVPARRVMPLQAHRGGSPDNTMKGMRESIEQQGVDEIEIDVQESSDGVLILTHDDTLGKNSNRPGTQLHTKSWDWIQKNVRVEGQRIPTLDDAIDIAMDNGVAMFVEMKSYKGQSKSSKIARARKISDRLLKLNATQRRRVRIHSFDWMDVGPTWTKHAPELRWYALETASTGGPTIYRAQKASDMGATGYAMNIMHASVPLIENVKRIGLKMRLWATEDYQSLCYCLDMGMEIFGSDDVEWAKGHLAKEKIALLKNKRDVYTNSSNFQVLSRRTLTKNKRYYPKVVADGLPIPYSKMKRLSSVTIRITVYNGGGRGYISFGPQGSATSMSRTQAIPKGTKVFDRLAHPGDHGNLRIFATENVNVKVEVVAYRTRTY